MKLKSLQESVEAFNENCLYDTQILLARREKQLTRIIAEQRARHAREAWHPWPEEAPGLETYYVYVKDGCLRWKEEAFYDGCFEMWRSTNGDSIDGTVIYFRELPKGPGGRE